MLNKLIDSHRVGEHLKKLHDSHIDTIVDWEERVDVQFKKLDSLMKVLYEDISKLKILLNKKSTKQNEVNSNEWSNKVGDMALGMLLSGFHHTEQNMKEFRELAIFEKKHLLDILKELELIDEIFK